MRPFVKRFALSYRTVVCLSCPVLPVLSCPVRPVLSVTLVYCGQTDGWIKMPLGMEIGLGPRHIVLDGDPTPPQKGDTINFRPMSVVARLDGSRCHFHLVWPEPGGRPRPGHIVLDGDPAPPPNKKAGTVPNFRPMSDGQTSG